MEGGSTGTIKVVCVLDFGVMISPMAPHVANAGTPVHVFGLDRSAADAPARAPNGITFEDTAKAVARAADVATSP